VSVHHVELWVADLGAAVPRWEWLLGALGWTEYQQWEHGRSWRAPGGTDAPYVVLEQSPALRPGAPHDRLAPGLNHLALHAPSRPAVDALVEDAATHGWSLMFADRHPWAGGPQHYAAYLEDQDGFEVEVVAPGD
jgi:catechol 2,3-dioxygenase-like lactoylglutathione lyase family enzyme